MSDAAWAGVASRVALGAGGAAVGAGAGLGSSAGGCNDDGVADCHGAGTYM